MGKEILVNVANRETRIAILDDNQLVELRVEREEQVVGNIYKGRVENVLPGMDAAFVDIGLDRNAFLYVADILPEYVDSDDDDEGSTVGDLNNAQTPPARNANAAQKEVVAAPRASRRRRRGRDRQSTESTEQVDTAEASVDSEDTTTDFSSFLSDPDRLDAEAGVENTLEDEQALASERVQDYRSISDDFGDEQDDESANEQAAAAVAFESETLSVANEGVYDDDDESESEDAAYAQNDHLIDSSEDNAEKEAVDAEFFELEEASAGDAEQLRHDIDSADEEDASLREKYGIDSIDESDDISGEYGPDEDFEGIADLEAEDGSSEPEQADDANPAPRAEAIGQAKRAPRRMMRSGRSRQHVPIQKLVQPRQELLLQVVKGPRGTKGSRVSTRMSLPGRYLVLMPDANNLGVSRKIEDARERDRLKTAVERFRQQGYGIIVRTEAEGRTVRELYQDYMMLTETWESIWSKAKTTPAPGLVHQDQSLIYAIMRDAFGSDIDRLIIDSSEDYARAYEIIDRISPDLADRIHLYDGAKPMFEQFKIEDDIERLLRRKVWLKSGGYLVIDQTEALTSIDVNTGKFIGSTGLSETILQTNMEATNEIGRQLRLRDIGGMIVLDFIDMDNLRDKKSVTDALYRALKNDRSRTKISSISPLGLIEMTRKRTKETVDVAMTDTCPYCHGIGRVPSAETISMQVEREIAKLTAEVNSDSILVVAHPDVVAHLVGEQGEDIDRLERQVRRAIYVRAQPHYHIEKYEVEPGGASRIEQSYPVPKRGQVVECTVQKSVISMPPWSLAYIDGGFQVEIENGGKHIGQTVRVRLNSTARSYAVGEAVGGQPFAKQGQRPQERGSRPVGAGRN